MHAQQSVTGFTSGPLPVLHFLLNALFYQYVISCLASLPPPPVYHIKCLWINTLEKNPTVFLFRKLQEFSSVLSDFFLSQSTAILGCSTLPSCKRSPQLGLLIVSTSYEGLERSEGPCPEHSAAPFFLLSTTLSQLHMDSGIAR